MDEPLVTITGHIGGEIRRRQAGETPVADFNVAVTPATRDRSTDDWVPGVTQWYRVTAWRRLAVHCGDSLRSGEPVVVHGRLTHRTWVNNAGASVTDAEIDAVYVGHDLRRGTAVFSRAAPSPSALSSTAPSDGTADEASREEAA